MAGTAATIYEREVHVHPLLHCQILETLNLVTTCMHILGKFFGGKSAKS